MIYFPIPHRQTFFKKNKTTQHFTIQACTKPTHMIYPIWGREEQLFLCLTCALAFRPCTVKRNLHPTLQDLIQQKKKRVDLWIKRTFFPLFSLPLREQSCPQPRTKMPLSSYPVINSQPRLTTPGLQGVKQKKTSPTLKIFSPQLHKDSSTNRAHTL